MSNKNKNKKLSEKEYEDLGIIKLKYKKPTEYIHVVDENFVKKMALDKSVPDVSTALKPDKYWIKEGVACYHVDYPDLKMRVMKINQVPKEINDGTGKLVVKMFTVNIDVQWIDKEQKLQSAKYTTRELRQL